MFPNARRSKSSGGTRVRLGEQQDINLRQWRSTFHISTLVLSFTTTTAATTIVKTVFRMILPNIILLLNIKVMLIYLVYLRRRGVGGKGYRWVTPSSLKNEMFEKERKKRLHEEKTMRKKNHELQTRTSCTAKFASVPPTAIGSQPTRNP